MSTSAIPRSAGSQAAAPSETPGTRLVSLDAFRGMVMLFMVLVNDPGDGRHVYWPLNHAKWNGWTPTDVVFPSFLWIIGVAITLSTGKRLAAGVQRNTLLLQALRRAAVLFVLGLIVYAYPRFDLATQRIPGVLQRLAVCYLIATMIYLTAGIRGQILWIAGLLTSYWLLMLLVPVPGYGAGRLDMEGNLSHYVDRIVFGAHNYVNTKTWDPEGLVSTLPSIATALFGVLAGHLLQMKKSLAERTTWLFLAGNLLLAAGQIAHYWMPINKKLWTSSFSVFMAGLDFVMFAAFVWLIDGKGYQRFVKPLVIMGMNAIAVYMASELGDELMDWSGAHKWVYSHLFEPIASPWNASLLYALAYTGAIYLIAYGLYRKKWFLRV